MPRRLTKRRSVLHLCGSLTDNRRTDLRLPRSPFPRTMPDPTLNPHHARRWTILAVLGIAQLMVVLDATIVNIALPSAQQDLGFSNDSRQWIVTAYALAFGSLLPLGGR